MKTRIISALLTLALLLPLAFTACGPKGDSGNDTGASTPSADGTGSGEKPPVTDPNATFDGFTLTATGEESYDISDNLFGIFLEDINRVVDGGLYAELIENRSFEYGSMAPTGGKHAWSADSSKNVTFDVIDGAADSSCLNVNNTHYARVTNSANEPHGIYSTGFYKTIAVEKDAEYKFSFYARAVNGYSGKIYVSIESTSKTYAEGAIDAVSGEWHKYEVNVKATETSKTGLRAVVRLDAGTVDLDMISLFPKDTYKGRENGMRRDIAEIIEDLTPRFFRFPGGCIIEGQTLEYAYDWKASIGYGLEFEINGEKTVGDVATRPLQVDIWAGWDENDKPLTDNNPYYMSYGAGFYEYFLFCEDLDCEPIPVLNCGLSCQGRPHPSGPRPGTEEFQRYIDDALDLVEFCMGDTDTEWGAIRAAMGHPEKFELHYLAIGNEQFGNEYNIRYAKFREAFNKAKEENPELYGDIKLIMANGLTSGSTDGWDAVAAAGGGTKLADSLDEHYYNEPTWFLMSENRYDSYDRNGPTVFIGEYAAKSNTSRAAIAEAAYLTSVERNGDIVELAAYAPLLANDSYSGWKWTPDMIWFNGTTVWGTPNYYVQKIYMNNQSDKIIPSELDGSNYSKLSSLTGRFGLGTWVTSAKFDDVKVVDNKTGDVLYSNDFSSGTKVEGSTTVGGSFSVRDGALMQTNTGYPKNDVTGDVMYIGKTTWSNYTLTFKATKLGGGEGFIIPFAVKNSQNFFHWNIGGWGNTISALEFCESGGDRGLKSGQLPGTVKKFTVRPNHEYEIKIVLNGYNIKGYIDNELMFDFDAASFRSIYSVIGEDENDIIIKLVNTSESKNTPIRIDISKISEFTGEVTAQKIMFGNKDAANNATSTPIKIREEKIEISPIFDYTITKYSMVVIRIPKK